jgi:hypothetical protein
VQLAMMDWTSVGDRGGPKYNRDGRSKPIDWNIPEVPVPGRAGSPASKAAMRREEHFRAPRSAEEALVDAQLASEKTGSEKVQQNLAVLRKTIRTLKDELDQKVGY